MNTHLPADLEQFVQAKSCEADALPHPTEAITAAVIARCASRKKPRRPASWRASARAWRTCGPVAGGRRRRCSLTSAVSSTFPRTHDLPHCRRAYSLSGRFGPPFAGRPKTLPPPSRHGGTTAWSRKSTRSAAIRPVVHWPPKTTSSPRKSASCSTAGAASRYTSTAFSSPSARTPSTSFIS